VVAVAATVVLNNIVQTEKLLKIFVSVKKTKFQQHRSNFPDIIMKIAAASTTPTAATAAAGAAAAAATTPTAATAAAVAAAGGIFSFLLLSSPF